jgi:hypothetical protein
MVRFSLGRVLRHGGWVTGVVTGGSPGFRICICTYGSALRKATWGRQRGTAVSATWSGGCTGHLSLDQQLEPEPETVRVDQNQNPKPFVWTKTAEDILQSPSKYIAKISDAGH